MKVSLSHSRDTDTLHVPTLPCHARANSVRSGDCYKPVNADDGKAKSRDTRATNCGAGTRERPANLFILTLLVGVAMHPRVSLTSVFLAGHFTHTLFHTFLYRHNSCTLHSGQDLRIRNAYGRV